ncbi:TVP38/TMEM64 family protein [Jannaschia sp. S6380]|uniref:TVP38/TMEM64 family protein n=1 Tax=Jannaschia sp. S6380 TaxID=2926408 RepID=UPI001FF26B10|nr:TVP38/TMEM64 family protein [Jannaschia sp. S6380]MCK0169356.1 TVP38/TMEM64 family protein [Jannaschia sp. S6380]
MTDRTMNTRPDNPRSVARYLPLAVIGVVALGGAFLLREHLNFATLAENRETLLAFRDANYPATVAVVLLAYVVIVAFSLPGAAIATLTGGFLFGVFPGALFNAVAATLGATAIFLAAKHGLGDRLAAKMDAAGGAARRLREGIREDETSYLFIMRLVPAVPFFVANLVPAFVGVGLRKYVVTTFLGILPGTVVYTWVGAGLGEVFARGETPDLGIIFEPHILGPIIGLVALACLPIAVKKLRRKG